MRRLGDILVAQGAVAREEVERLAALPGFLGHRLRTETLIRGRALARALAEQQQLALPDLNTAPPDARLYDPGALAHYQQGDYLPYRREGDRLTVITPEPSQALQGQLEAHYGCAVALAVVSRRDFTDAMARLGGTTLTRRARVGLRRRHRGLAADRVLLAPQAYGLLLLAIVVVVAVIVAPSSGWDGLLIACNLFYLITLAFKLFLYGQARDARHQPPPQAAPFDPAGAPVYSILVPLYGEDFAVVGRLIGHLHALDYPKDKLDIKLICEADDTATIAAIKACRPPETMEIIRVPPSQPRTKPKACNVALQQIRGEYLVIFDAEDAPAPDQLRKAAGLFAALPPEVACLQGALNYYNREENLLTRLFAIEYSALFHLLLPALQQAGLPIPLGGTSNHLRVEALRACGGWDAFNVTEDADLGIRLAYFGYRTRMLPSLTLEEAPIALGAWLKQRTRWIKGYVQTWLVFMRAPGELKRRLGRTGYYGFQFFIGAPSLTFLLAPVFWGVFLLGALGLVPYRPSPAMLALCGVSFVGGIAVHWLYARAVIQREQWKNMRMAVLCFPFYWLLHSLAAARAVWQLALRPHYWDKTHHGISRLFRLDTGQQRR